MATQSKASVSPAMRLSSDENPTNAFQYYMCDSMCNHSHMATNLSIDPELLDKALRVGGEKTKKAAVTQALLEFIA